ncbi:MAG TPA: TonB-dependent receptor, partial [Paraburkholderia sp.]|uniref:TonB-dependent receptor n=1 Tax=Paraburkholderia sp. TaxID=1926495 RepID=UPI002B468F87
MTLVHSDCVRTLVRHCGFAILCGGAATLAHAQSATGTEAQENKIALDEVVVTAQKIETTEQRTPISMTVFSPEVLAREGVGNLDDLVARAPSASMARSGFSSIVTVRGVSSRDTTEVGDPSVAINIDGLYFTRAIGFSDSLFDLERVEILRGPQGTLYGRNATGGAINLISAKPTSEFEGTGAIGFGNYNLLTTEGMLNVPLS